MAKKAKGIRGSWFATVDGERLPCVHDHWWKGTSYDDPGIKPSSKASELVDAIREKKRVILTKDKAIPSDNDEAMGFDRKGYIAIFSVDLIEFDDAGLRFKFVKRLEDLE